MLIIGCMGRKTSIIPKAAAAKIIFNAGAKRVAAPAAEALVDVLIDRAGEIAARAVRIAKHSPMLVNSSNLMETENTNFFSFCNLI